MQNLRLLVLAFAILLCGLQAFAAETNRVGTNSVSTGATNDVVAPKVSDAELQAHARTVLVKILILAVVALAGVLMVAGFALYKAHQKFGVKGVVVVALILAVGVVIFGAFLLSV